MSALDKQKLREVLAEDYSYYGGPDHGLRKEVRLNLGARDFIALQFSSEMRVLDVGCGNGVTLLENSHLFREGLGIDDDPAHLEMAKRNLKEREIANVDFQLVSLFDLPKTDAAPFDFVFSERGPFGGDSRTIQAALHVLKSDGVIFWEAIGELHQRAVQEVFGRMRRYSPSISVLEQVKVAMARNGVEIRLAADLISKWTYPDIYEWLKFQCSIWSWIGAPLPSADSDFEKFRIFAERNTTPAGEIETTHHVVWVAGVKMEEPPNYGEFQHFTP